MPFPFSARLPADSFPRDTTHRIGRLIALGSAAVLAFGVPHTAAAAQSIDETIHCPECVIEFDRTGSLSWADAPLTVGMDAEVLALPGGGYAVTSGIVTVSVLLHDADGSFRTEVGRRGEGPGEFASTPRLGAAVGDGFLVHDGRLGRLTYIENSGEIGWFERVEITSTQVAAAGDGFVLAGFGIEGSTGYHLRFLELEEGMGAEGLSEAAMAGEVELSGGSPNWLRMAGADDGLWAIPQGGGLLKRYDASGTQLAAYEVPLGPTPEEMGGLVVYDVAVVDGKVWIFRLLPPPSPDAGSGGPLTEEVATRIIIFDPAEERMHAADWLEPMVRPMHGEGGFHITERDDGEIQVDVGILRLVEPGG